MECKIIYTLILPSLNFRKTHPKRETERKLKHTPPEVIPKHILAGQITVLGPSTRAHTPEDRERARWESEEDNPTSVGLITSQFMPQPHRTVIIFAIDLHCRSRKLSLLFSSLFPSDQPKPRSYQTHPPILPLSDPPADLAAVKPTRPSCLLQTHSQICGPVPKFSLNLSLPLPLSRSVLCVWERLNFFLGYVLLLIRFIYSDFLL